MIGMWLETEPNYHFREVQRSYEEILSWICDSRVNGEIIDEKYLTSACSTIVSMFDRPLSGFERAWCVAASDNLLEVIREQRIVQGSTPLRIAA